MISAEKIQNIENQLVELLVDYPALFLVSVKTDAKNNIRVYLDGDNGVTIDDCARLNRKLYKYIETLDGLADGNFSLEVSSPGLDEPLHLLRQYKKNLGRPVELQLIEGTETEGVLKEVNEEGIVLECTRGKGKKQEQFTEAIPFAQIKTTRIKIII